jgi:hypothetical protein
MIEAPDKAICAMSQEAKDQFNEERDGLPRERSDGPTRRALRELLRHVGA